MVRRGSQSSIGSPHGSLRQPFSGSSIQRRGSNASMTERTFRSPSPGPRNAPLIGTIPEDTPPVPQRSQMRASSQDTRGPANVGVVRASSTTRAQAGRGSAISTSQQHLDGAGSSSSPRGSVNFSRPMSPPPAPSARMSQQPARPASSQGFYPMSIAAQVRQAERDRAAQRAGGIVSRPVSRAGPPAAHAASVAARPSSSLGQAPLRSSMSPPSARPSSSLGHTTLRSSMSPSSASLSKPPPTQARPPVARPQSPPSAAPVKTASLPSVTSTTSPSAQRPSQAGGASSSALNIAKRVSLAPVVNDAPASGRTPPTARTGPISTSGPNQDQIKAAQAKAAQAKASAHLARPLTQLERIPSDGPATITSNAGPRTLAGAAPNSTMASAASKPHSRSVSQPMSSLRSGPTNIARKSSVSPSRSARFLEAPYTEPTKHQPLPRAASPFKSAMKGSTPRGPSPATVARMPNLPGVALSDTSEAVSEDGSSIPPQKRKGVRVSFDEQAAIVGEAAAPQSPTSGARPDADTWHTEQTGMAPRPALPAFGSVRGRSPVSEASGSPSQYEKQVRASASTETAPVESSADSAAGGILSHDFAQKREAYRREFEESDNTTKPIALDVPSIALLPSTPGLDEQKELADQIPASSPAVLEGPYVPGLDEAPSVPSSQSTSIPSVQELMRRNHEADESDDTAELYEDAEEQSSELEDGGGYASLDAIIESPAVESAAPFPPIAQESMVHQPATQPTPGSVVTVPDAAPVDEEDWERVKNYWSSLSENRRLQLEQEAGVVREGVEPSNGRIPERDASQQRVATTPPWPDHEKRDAVERKPTALKQSLRGSTHQRADSEPIHMRTSMRDGPAPVKDGPASNATSLRTSMRNDRSRPSSSVASAAAPRASTSNRPVSAASNRAEPAARSSSSNASTTQAASTALAIAIAKQQAQKPKLQRTTSNDSSASESSFRKKHRSGASSDAGGRYTMKRSMRGAAVEENSARPMSPAQPVVNRASMRSPPPSMKNTMRGPPASLRTSGEATLRGSDQPAAKSSSFMGFGKGSKQKPTKSKPGKKFTSRFGDSSDEDDDGPSAGPRTFASRFDDSDDEDEPAQVLRPVRGIPKRSGLTSGDSTDLDDSDDEAEKSRPTAPPIAKTPAAAPVAPMPSTPIKTNGAAAEGQTLHAGTLRADTSAPSSPSQPKAKRGFFGFGRKKTAMGSAPSSPALATPGSPATAIDEGTPSRPAAPAALDFANAVPTSTAVASETPAARPETVSIPKTLREQEPAPSVKSERGRKMFRRWTASAGGSPTREPKAEDFPYPPPPIPDQYKESYTGADRPNTSDGIQGSTMRPGMGDKRVSTMTAPDSTTDKPLGIYSSRTGKKKRFQGLRKAFGIYD